MDRPTARAVSLMKLPSYTTQSPFSSQEEKKINAIDKKGSLWPPSPKTPSIWAALSGPRNTLAKQPTLVLLPNFSASGFSAPASTTVLQDHRNAARNKDYFIGPLGNEAVTAAH